MLGPADAIVVLRGGCPRRLLAAMLFGLQLIGMRTLFFLTNLAIGLACVRPVRGTTGTFASAYNANSLCALSARDGECCACAWGSIRDRR